MGGLAWGDNHEAERDDHEPRQAARMVAEIPGKSVLALTPLSDRAPNIGTHDRLQRQGRRPAPRRPCDRLDHRRLARRRSRRVGGGGGHRSWPQQRRVGRHPAGGRHERAAGDEPHHRPVVGDADSAYHYAHQRLWRWPFGFRGVMSLTASSFQPAEASFAALGTTASVLVTVPWVLADAEAELRAAVRTLDAACSRFRTDSDLARVNAGAGRPVAAPPVLIDAVSVALRAARLTSGLVDPTVGRAMRLIGYDRDFAQVSTAGRGFEAVFQPVPGWQAVEVDAEAGTITVPAGVELDLGATAKARCADVAAARIAAATGSGVLVNLGGDIAVAGEPPAGGWPVRVSDRHDDEPEAPGQTIRLHDGGLATSGVAARRWAAGGRWMHHVVDPRTGAPAAEVWRTVSVAASTCVDANAASTAAVILGVDALDWLAGVGLPARLVTTDGAEVRVAGWPADEDAWQR